METVLIILAFFVVITVVLFVVRVIVLLPNVVAQVSADGIKGFWSKVQTAIHYLCNPAKLTTVFIRDGEFSHKPVRLVHTSEHKPSDNDNQY